MLLQAVKKQNNSRLCMVCGVANPQSMQGRFYELEDDTLVGVLIGHPSQQSYPGRMHGGAITAMLDEVIGRAINISEPEAWGVTVDMTTKFLKPVPVGVPLILQGRVLRNRRLIYFGEGRLILPDGSIAATATANYMKRPLEKIANFQENGDSYEFYPWTEDEPHSFDLPEWPLPEKVDGKYFFII